MSEPNVPETANVATAPAESTPAQKVEELSQAVSQAVPPESATGTKENAAVETSTNAGTQTPVKGSEPVEPPKVVEELRHVRKRAQEAERKAAYLEGQLEEARKATTTPAPLVVQSQKQEEIKVPNLNDYPDYDKYNEAVIEYKIDVREKNREVAEQQKKEQEKQEQERKKQSEVDHNFYTKVNKVLEKYPDYHEAIQAVPFDLHVSVLSAIKESEVGPEVAYYLAKNPSDAERISNLSKANPLAAVKEIGKIEAKLTLVQSPVIKTTKQVTQAPEPIKPLGGTANPTTKSLDELSIDEYMKKRNEETFVKVGSRLQPKR